MKCFNGITVHSSNTVVPCGQCINCRINKGRKWTCRLLLEWYSTDSPHSPHSWMLTLTYAPEFVPRTPDGEQTLRRSHVVDWIKKQRRYQYPGLRWYVVGEYGDKTGRPHYHLAVFGLSYTEKDHLRNRWPYGHTRWSEMDGARAAYCAAYTTKKLTSPDDRRLLPGMEPEFRASSRTPPIGTAGVDALISRYRRGPGKTLVSERGDVERSVRIHGKIYPLDNWALARMRRALHIPQLHGERAAENPRYLDFHEAQEAECKPEINRVLEDRHAKKAKHRQINRASL